MLKTVGLEDFSRIGLNVGCGASVAALLLRNPAAEQCDRYKVSTMWDLLEIGNGIVSMRNHSE
jgi:hypothetical protein